MSINFTENKFTINRNIFTFENEIYNFKKIIKQNLNNFFNNNFDLNQIHNIINNNYMNNKDIDFFNQVPIFGKTDRSSLFVKIYHNYFDKSNEFSNLYNDFMKNFIKSTFFPNEEFIIVQKTPNLRVQIPYTTNLGK